MKPDFVDNRGGNKLADALRGHLAWLRASYKSPLELSIATGYFDPYGFVLIADELEKLAGVRLMIGAEPEFTPARELARPGAPKGEERERDVLQRALKSLAGGLEMDRNLLGFAPEVDGAVRRLIAFLRSGKVEVRRYEKAFLHGKAYIFSTEEGVIAGSSNFTAAGLTKNLELNLGRYDPRPVSQVRNWFDDLWKEAVPYDLASIYDARFQPFQPYLVYLRVLWELFGQEIGQEAEGGPIRLTTFQRDGLFRARRIMERYNGVIFADGVGLGKTFIGGELIRETVKEHRQRALLIAPAALRDGTWSRFADQHQLYVERVSYEQLAADPVLGGDGPSCLRDSPDKYSLIVIDEGQAFRNPETERARALRRLLRGDPPKKVVFLTATPVNNSLWDLYYVLTYFIGHDAAFMEKGIPSLKARFAEATAEDPFSLRPDTLFDVLDATTVRRTRNFIKRYYPNDRIRGPNGVEIPIRFPKPRVRSVRYEFKGKAAELLGTVAKALAPEEGTPGLSMARYSPASFLRRKPRTAEEKAEVVRELALVGLLRSALLKRLESSPHAFAETVSRMLGSHEAFLKAITLGYVPRPEALEEWEPTESDAMLTELLQDTRSDPASLYDLSALKKAVESDCALLTQFEGLARQIKQPNDPKLRELADTLAEIAKAAEKEGRTAEDIRNKRKVIVFSYFEDTIDWVERFLLDAIETDPRLTSYKGRLVSVVGGQGRSGVGREAAVFGFAPVSSEAPPGQEEDRFDIMLSTDVLAEGQNLQQCRNVVNYDLPWNPMRLVQRHGRVDRIGSPHASVFIWCFFPARELDQLLGLEERIRRKLAQAAASIGVEAEVIPSGATSEVVFTETKKEIQALRAEDTSLFENAGEDPDAHSGEEYRQELRRGMAQWGRQVEQLPWCAGSGFRRKGLNRNPGWFFCARIGDKIFLRFVPAGGGLPIRQTLGCLREIVCDAETPREVNDGVMDNVYGAWEGARDDIFREWSRLTDPRNLQPKVRPLFRRIAEHLRRYPPKDMPAADLDRVVEAIEAPWGMRIENELRASFGTEGVDPPEISKLVVEKVRELGLQPFKAPEPLPPIEATDIALVCWLAVS